MQILPIDLNGLVAVILGISVVLIPVIGLTARYALKPFVETLARFFDNRELGETVQILERRMGLLEHQLDSMDASLKQLVEVTDFHRALGSPGGPGTAPGAGPPAQGSAGSDAGA